MAVSTKGNKYLGKRTKPVIAEEGMELTLSEMNYSEISNYIDKKYLPEIKDAQMTFMISGTGFGYDYKSPNATNELLKYYKEQSDYTEKSLDENTDYRIEDWAVVRKDIDPETNEEYTEELEEITADNTYNFSYLGMMDLDWRVYYDEVYDKYFYVIHPHLGGDIRGNYGEAFILEGDDKEELFYRYYEEFISGFASIYIELTDGSNLYFDSQQDSDFFYFEFNDYQSEINSDLAQELVEDFDSFDRFNGDEFIEQMVDKFNAKNKNSETKFSGGGYLDEPPSIYVEVLGTGKGKWMSLDGMTSGYEVMEAIENYIDELNDTDDGSRVEYRIADMEGFGNQYFYDEYMSESNFDDLLYAYQEYESSDFPAELIFEYANDNNLNIEDAIRSMSDNYYGAYNEPSDFAYQMVEEGIYTPSMSDVSISETDMRLISSEEADNQLNYLSNLEIIEKAGALVDFESRKSSLENDITDLQDDIAELEEELENSEDEDYDVISDAITDKETELSELEEQLFDLEEVVAEEERYVAFEELYEETYSRLENDLEDWLSEYGYENVSDANFLIVDYDSIADELSQDYMVYEADGKYFYFLNYMSGGKIHSVGKPKDYNYYVIERISNKIISGHDTKSEANKHKSELKRNNHSLKLDVYPRAKVEMDFDIDTTSHNSFVSVDNFKYGGKVKLRSKVNAKSDKDTWKTSSEIKSKLSLARAGVEKYEKDELNKLKKDLSRVRAKNYMKHKTFNLGGMTDNDVLDMLPDDKKPEEREQIKRQRMLDTHRSVKNIKEPFKKGANWIKRQWEEADFGDGTGKAKFKEGGYVIGDEVIYLRKGKEQVGRITDVLEDGQYVVFGGKGFGISESMVDDSNIIGLKPKRKRLFFADGGMTPEQIRNAFSIGELMDEQGNVVTDKQKMLQMVYLAQRKSNPSLFAYDKGGSTYQGGGEVSKGDLIRTYIGQIYYVQNPDYSDLYMWVSEDEDSEQGYTLLKSDVAEILNSDYAKGGSTYAGGGNIGEWDEKQVHTLSVVGFNDEGNLEHLGDIEATNKTPDGVWNQAINYFPTAWYVEVLNKNGDAYYEVSQETEYEPARFVSYAGGGSIEKQNKSMLENDAVQIEHHSEELNKVVPKTNKVPAWVIGKTSRINSDLSDVTHYLDGKSKSKKKFKQGGSTNKKWIQGAVKEMEKKGTKGAFTRQAKRHGMTPIEFANEVVNNPEKYTERTRKRANFVLNVTDSNKMNQGGTTITKPKPIVKPTITPKPDKNNPYLPKTKPNPKAVKYDFLFTNS